MAEVLSAIKMPGPSDRPSTSARPPKAQRVLACVLCQKRKLKCDRRFPCANCLKSKTQCVQATLAPRRRRRHPERDLLDRIRRYEDLLRTNNIAFEPLHKDAATAKGSGNADSGDESDAAGVATPSTSAKSEQNHESKGNVWHAMNKGFRDPDKDSDSSDDGVREATVRNALDAGFPDDERLLFGFQKANLDLLSVHPDPAHVFRLWQIFLDNVNPVLKVVHAPSLQASLVQATSNIASVEPNLEALMFSVYCTSIISLTAEDCQTMFFSAKEDLLLRFQSGCQQALSNCAFLRSDDRNSLVALYLYLISIRPTAHPKSLNAMLGVAIRVAQRIGIDNESSLSKCSPFEGEMRRRLWWSLLAFDTRMGDLMGGSVEVLDPTWNCRVPLNVADTDLRPDMKILPNAQAKPTEALFAVIRGQLGDYVRHTHMHLDFSNPALKAMVKRTENSPPIGAEFSRLEEIIEDRYLKYCDQENPIHFMTVWSTRALLAKYRLMEQNLKFASSAARQTEAEHDLATNLALTMLECDTKAMTSTLSKGFQWMNHWYFPFPGYYQTVQDLRRRPDHKRAWHAWEVMSDNYEAWFEHQFNRDSTIFQLFSKMITQAWITCEASYMKSANTPPRIVIGIKQTLTRLANEQTADFETANFMMGMSFDDLQMPMSNTGYAQGLPFGSDDYSNPLAQTYSMPSEQGPDLVDSTPIYWDGLLGWSGWGGD